MASPTRVSGMVSGIDTESVVKAYVQNYVDKKNKVKQSQTKLTYKQDAWKALNTKVYSMYSKVGNLRFSTSYNLKKTTVSDTTKATVTASSNAVIGSQTLKITQLAKAGYLTGAQLAKKTTEDSTMASLGYDKGETTISVRAGSGQEKEITINNDTKISEVIDALKDAGVNASYDANNRRIFVSAKESGTDNDFALTASTTKGQDALSALGLVTTSAGDINGYAANAAYAKNTEGENYYVLDEDGKITYDEEGNAITNGTYDAAKTKENISNILTTLANKYYQNNKLSADNATLNDKIKYSENKDIVDDVKARRNDEAGITGEDLVNLVNEGLDGKTYVDDAGNTYREIKFNGDGTKTYYNDSESDGVTVASDVDFQKISDKVKEMSEQLGLITKSTGEDGNETTDESEYQKFLVANDVYNKYVKDGVDNSQYYLDSAARETAKSTVETNNTTIENNNTYISENSYWDKKDYSDYYDETGNVDASKISELADSIVGKIKYGLDVVTDPSTITASAGATRVTGQDAKIVLNGADYSSNTNNFSINGLSISATAETGDKEITITTTQDNQGIYDKVKDFLSTYNELINEMQSLYNAESAKGYEPLTDDQKDEMSEKEIEKWEDKIKSAILRRDSSLGSLINKMTMAMSTPINIKGRGYSLSDFGIQTLGYLNAAKNEQYAYHIDGDADDETSSGKQDKLMAMINSDPETVIDYMQSLASNLYNAVGTEMKSSSLRTAYTVYNDKEMASEQKKLEKSIKDWETKISAMEDRYYKKFSKMEATLAKLQNSTNSLSQLTAR
jgi:flagellar hook-associated protein 2